MGVRWRGLPAVTESDGGKDPEDSATRVGWRIYTGNSLQKISRGKLLWRVGRAIYRRARGKQEKMHQSACPPVVSLIAKTFLTAAVWSQAFKV
jgi:hypothetical protein